MDIDMVAKGDWQTFLSLKGEKILMVTRKHHFVVIVPIIIISCLALFFISSAFFFFEYILISHSLFIVTTLLLISAAISLITKAIIDWYFHMYMVTNRKILELRYTPLTSYLVNDVMLDRVSCTEIDLRTNGFLNELIDMGDIIMTFDRPTHQEEFVLKDICGSHKLANFLTQKLMDDREQEPVLPMWYRRPIISRTT